MKWLQLDTKHDAWRANGTAKIFTVYRHETGVYVAYVRPQSLTDSLPVGTTAGYYTRKQAQDACEAVERQGQ